MDNNKLLTDAVEREQSQIHLNFAEPREGKQAIAQLTHASLFSGIGGFDLAEIAKLRDKLARDNEVQKLSKK